jgi:hypothetical protein
MDNIALQMIIERVDRIENKVDTLLEFKWKVVGGTILASLVLTSIFQIVLAFIESHK